MQEEIIKTKKLKEKSLKQTPCRHICALPCQCGHCVWISLRSIIRGGLAGAGGCGPCSHQIKEHKSEGMRGRRSRGNCGCGYTSLTCFILLRGGSSLLLAALGFPPSVTRNIFYNTRRKNKAAFWDCCSVYLICLPPFSPAVEKRKKAEKFELSEFLRSLFQRRTDVFELRS